MISLSRRQQQVFDLFAADGTKISTAEIVTAIYGDKPPINARVVIINQLRTIETKLDLMNAEYRLCSSKRNGPHPIQFWVEKRDGKI